VQEAEELQREMQALEEERASLLRDAALAGEMEAQYAKRGTLQVQQYRSGDGYQARAAAPTQGAGRTLRGWLAPCTPILFLPAQPPTPLLPPSQHLSSLFPIHHCQAREIRDQKSRITTLENGLARMAAEFEAEKAALEAGLRAQLADAVAEQNTLRRWGGLGSGWQQVVNACLTPLQPAQLIGS